jgi:SAM-dependent methyltransferase
MTPSAIDYFSIRHPLRAFASQISFQVRRKIFERFMTTMKPISSDRVLDVGVTPDRQLPESNFFEQLYPYKNRLTVTSIEDASFLENIYPGLHFVQTDTLKLPFEDLSFDIAFCSAVLEHVGNRMQQQQFIVEILRVSKSIYIITPNRQFPVEFHTFLPLIHWLPQPIHQYILNTLGLTFWSKTDNLNLLTPNSFKSLFPQTTRVHLDRIRLIGIPSNLVAWKSAKQEIPHKSM